MSDPNTTASLVAANTCMFDYNSVICIQMQPLCCCYGDKLDARGPDTDLFCTLKSNLVFLLDLCLTLPENYNAGFDKFYET